MQSALRTWRAPRRRLHVLPALGRARPGALGLAADLLVLLALRLLMLRLVLLRLAALLVGGALIVLVVIFGLAYKIKGLKVALVATAVAFIVIATLSQLIPKLFSERSLIKIKLTHQH